MRLRALLGLDEASEEVLGRFLCRLEGASGVDGRLRLRDAPSAVGLLVPVDLELLRGGFLERLSLSELTVPPHKCQSCRHCVQGSKFQLVVQ